MRTSNPHAIAAPPRILQKPMFAKGHVTVMKTIVATLDGQPAEDTDDLLALLSGERVGRSVPVGVVRGGEPQELNVTVGERG